MDKPMSTGPANDTVRVRVPAKINLHLGVGALGDDGYHRLTTVFQAVSLFDELIAEAAEPGVCELTMVGEGVADLPTDDRNLAVRAAALVSDRFAGGERLGVRMTIKKAIPIAGGMAGGSADAAAALLACSVLWDLDADVAELTEVAAELGSDVPFSVLGGTAIGTGRGADVVPALSRGVLHWVLAISEGGLSTPTVYRKFDELEPAGCDLAMPTGLLNALAGGDPVAVAPHLRNDLAAAAVSLDPSLQQTLDAGLEHGALAALVSGSGPTCAFLSRNEDDAVELAARIRADGVAGAVRRVKGPVPGARLLT